MASQPPPPPPRGGMSLYANLLDSPDAGSATISRAPVLFKQADGDDSSKRDGSSSSAKKDVNAALRFQPIIRRPAAPQKKAVKPMGFPKSIPPSAITTTQESQASVEGASPQVQASAKNTLADWTATKDDDVYYAPTEPKRKRKKKKKKDGRVETDWDEYYDPARPTNVEEYLRSDERIREVREWKDVLYKHRRKAGDDDDDDERSYYSEDEEEDVRPKNHAFAPPSSYNFAPPPPTSPPKSNIPDDATGDDAYARRLALSKGEAPPPPPPAGGGSSAPATTAFEATGSLSRAPVKYTQNSEPEPMDEDQDDQYSPPPSLGSGMPENEPPKSNRPGQAGFAQRLMSKYGWSAGTGLGASESGIVNPLQVRVEKRRKKPDSEGGGWAEPGNRAKIIGGQVSKATREKDEAESFGKMSEVIGLAGMLDNMSEEELAEEIREGGLQQEIGEECGENYGRVERLHIDTLSKRVYIKFTNQVSALRAVNSLQGRIFNGNAIVAKFFDSDKFEQREFA